MALSLRILNFELSQIPGLDIESNIRELSVAAKTFTTLGNIDQAIGIYSTIINVYGPYINPRIVREIRLKRADCFIDLGKSFYLVIWLCK